MPKVAPACLELMKNNEGEFILVAIVCHAEFDKVELDKVDEPLTFSPMAEEASEAGAIPMAANAIRQEAEMAHNEAIS